MARPAASVRRRSSIPEPARVLSSSGAERCWHLNRKTGALRDHLGDARDARSRTSQQDAADAAGRVLDGVKSIAAVTSL